MRAPSAFTLVALVLLPGFVLAPATASSDATIEQFLRIRAPGAPVLLPDGSLLMRDWPDGVWQLYRVAPRGSGERASYRPGEATATRLTDFPDGLSGFSVSPDGAKVVLMHATGGNENTQLTLLDLGAAPGSATTPVLADPKVQASVNVWLRDGSGFIYSANDASPNDFHLYRYDLATRRATSLLAREGSWSARDVNRDGARVLVQRRISASDVHCYQLEVATGALSEITVAPPGGTAACSIVGYAPGERAVLLRSDLKGGQQRLYLKDLVSGTVREPVPALGSAELEGAVLEQSRKFLVTVSNQDGYGVMRAYALPGFQPLRTPEMDPGVVSVAGFKDAQLVWTLNNARTPSTSYVTTLGTSPAVTRQLTWTDTQGLDLARFPLPELVRYPSFDRRSIPAWMFLPPGHAKSEPIPFVVLYHGGPEGQHRPTFNATMQYLLSRGFGVLMPNVRGSTGYGRAYQMLDDYKKRWDSVRDGVAAAEWLVASHHAAPGKIAAYGGSYGGFMSVACVVEDQERVDRGERKERMFGACVDMVGLVNLKTFLERTSGYRRKLREAEYGPLADPEFLASVSSIHRADKIQVPVFIGHGFNDPRVPVEEAMQLASALRERGRNPRMFIAPDEGHGFQKLDNRVYFGQRVAAFLEETLKGARAPAALVADPAE